MKTINHLAVLLCVCYLVFATLASGLTPVATVPESRPTTTRPVILDDPGNPADGQEVGQIEKTPTDIANDELIKIGTVYASEGTLLSIEKGTAVWQKGHGRIIHSNIETLSTVLLAIMTLLLFVTNRMHSITRSFLPTNSNPVTTEIHR